MRQLLLAVQFLTIVPVRLRGEVTEAQMQGSAVFFPIIGLLQGAMLLGVSFCLSYIAGKWLSSALIVLFLVLISGGFHLDGLADTMDGLASRGEREKRLDVMHDGATGPAGTAAIVSTLLIKFSAIGELVSFGRETLWLALLFMPALSKWVMLLCMNRSSPAREDGLGRIFIGRVGLGAVVANALLLVLLMVLYAMLAGWACEPLWHVFPIAALFIPAGFALVFNRSLKKAFGGQTGDTLGATGEMTEVLYLICLSAWLHIV